MNIPKGFNSQDLILKDLLYDNGGDKMTEYEVQESGFLSPTECKDVDGLRITILEEVKPQPSDFGQKDRAKVRITNGTESHEKLMNFNKPFINYLVKNHGKDSAKWIGVEVPITTKTIKGNLAIIPKEAN